MTETVHATIGGQRGLRPKLFRLLSRLTGEPFAYFLFRMADMLGFLINGVPRYTVGSVDITCRCNLTCRQCYFLQQGYDRELTDEQWIAKMDYLRDYTDFPFYQCSWVGGEPLLRKDLVRKLMPRFRSNFVATNGSIPLPDWRDCNFHVSVDGSPEYYRRMRGDARLYDRMKTNVNNAPQLKINAAMCVDRENWRCIPGLLEEWCATHVKGFLFQFYTPIQGVSPDLWMGWELRDRIIDMLIHLKRKYGDFIVNTVDQLRLMRSTVAPRITRDCAYAKIAYALGPDGKPKRPCVMGEKADCGRCGCPLPFHSWLLARQNVVIRELMLFIRRLAYGRWLPRLREEAVRRSRGKRSAPAQSQ